MKWIYPDGKSAINLENVRQIWIQESLTSKGFYLMGVWTGSNDSVVLSHVFEDKEDCKVYLWNMLGEND